MPGGRSGVYAAGTSVSGGGGGIPVVRGADGARHGVEAVIDKDRTAVLLATELGADPLLLLTDVPAVYRDWPERNGPIRRAASRRLRLAYTARVASARDASGSPRS